MSDNQRIFDLVGNQSHAAEVINDLTRIHGLTLSATPVSTVKLPENGPTVRRLVAQELTRRTSEMMGDWSVRSAKTDLAFFISSHREQIMNLILKRQPSALNYASVTDAVLSELASGPWIAQVTFEDDDDDITLHTAQSETPHPSVDHAMTEAVGKRLGPESFNMPLYYTLIRKSSIPHGHPTVITGTYGTY